MRCRFCHFGSIHWKHEEKQVIQWKPHPFISLLDTTFITLSPLVASSSNISSISSSSKSSLYSFYSLPLLFCLGTFSSSSLMASSSLLIVNFLPFPLLLHIISKFYKTFFLFVEIEDNLSRFIIIHVSCSTSNWAKLARQSEKIWSYKLVYLPKKKEIKTESFLFSNLILKTFHMKYYHLWL